MMANHLACTVPYGRSAAQSGPTVRRQFDDLHGAAHPAGVDVIGRSLAGSFPGLTRRRPGLGRQLADAAAGRFRVVLPATRSKP